MYCLLLTAFTSFSLPPAFWAQIIVSASGLQCLAHFLCLLTNMFNLLPGFIPAYCVRLVFFVSCLLCWVHYVCHRTTVLSSFSLPPAYLPTASTSFSSLPAYCVLSTFFACITDWTGHRLVPLASVWTIHDLSFDGVTCQSAAGSSWTFFPSPLSKYTIKRTENESDFHHGK